MTKKSGKKKSYNVGTSMKAKLAVKNIIENRGNVSKSMREAGYTDATAKNPKNLTESKAFKKEAKPIIDQLEKEIQEVIKILPDKRDKAAYGEAVGSMEKMQKLVELLGGRETERAGLKLNVVSYDESDDSI